MTDEDLVRSLLDYLRAATACPALAYAETPTRMSGGYDATILRFSLHGAPEPVSGPLVLRLFQSNVDAQRAPREAVQNALAGLGYPAPRVFVTEARVEALGGPFIVMERVPGLPLGSEFEGLRIKGLRQAFDTLRQLPGARREMLRLWDEAQTRLQSVEGVNLDEELVNLTTFQQAYNASARLVQASQAMITTLLNMVP